jgi:hypothetical protein
MEKIQLIIKPKSGLGNRIRAVSSFIYLKNLTNADLQVIWQEDKTLKAQYHDIFQENPNFTMLKPSLKFDLFISKNRLVNNKYGFVKTTVSLYNNFVKNLIGFDVLLLNNEVSKGVDYVRAICEKNKKILIITDDQCIEYKEGVQTFAPINEIASKIDKMAAGFKARMIGIHIRRTDHVVSMRNSPIYLFENKISEYMASENNDFGFFLATDDPETESYFKEKYPGIVFTYNKTFGRDTKEGITDAVIELYLLSRTSKIYGSYWSSFSGIASLLGDIELETLHL